jgi:hypothetical protein
LEVVNRPIAALKLNPKNARIHSRRQIRQIARSIRAFGFNVPVLVDADLNVIGGHGRIHASLELGLTEVPTICLEHLSEAQARAFMIADNRLTETSVWDDRLLAEQLKELSVLDLDFDLETTGFTMGEIDLRIEGLEAPPDKGNDPADTLPSVGAVAISRTGDLWELDQHRVYCGSALDAQVYTYLMGGERAAMVITDPPYNVRIDGHACGLGAMRHRDFVMASEEGNLAALHPTVKPVQMIADAILDCSARSEVVLDSFLGSGTTLIAAERTGRRCFGIEIDPIYVDCAIRRWQAFTGAKARHIETGRDFADLVREREASDV